MLESSAGKETISPSFLHWMDANGYDETSQEKMTSLPLGVMMSRGVWVMTGSVELADENPILRIETLNGIEL